MISPAEQERIRRAAREAVAAWPAPTPEQIEIVRRLLPERHDRGAQRPDAGAA